MNTAVAAHISWPSTSEMRAGDPHVEGLCRDRADFWAELRPRLASQRVGLRPRNGQRRATFWPTLARAAALGRVRQGAQTVAHKAKKPATAGAGRAVGWACAATY